MTGGFLLKNYKNMAHLQSFWY